MVKTITWVEIPAGDFKRALHFYSKLYGKDLEVTEMGGNPYAYLPNSHEDVGAAITEWPGFEPCTKGPLVYLNAGENLDAMLSRVENIGGKISTPKAFINEKYGYYATIIDSEGNKVALHSKH